jgi:hypothetical protein
MADFYVEVDIASTYILRPFQQRLEHVSAGYPLLVFSDPILPELQMKAITRLNECAITKKALTSKLGICLCGEFSFGMYCGRIEVD